MASRDVTVAFHADVRDLEAALARAGLASETAGNKIGEKFDAGTNKAASGIEKLKQSADGLELPFAGALDAVARKFDEATVHSNKFVGAVAAAGRTALVAGGAGLAAVAGEALRMGVNFQHSTATIQNSAHISAAAAKQIGDAFLATGGKTTFSAQQMADAYGLVAGKLGQVAGHALTTGEAAKFMSSATDLAEASQTNLSTATSALTKVLAPFHIGVGQAATAANILYNTSRVTAQPIDQLAQSAARLKGRLGILAPSLTDIGALMVKFQGYGLQGSRAMMQVNTAFQTLVGTNKTVNKVLDDLGVHVFDSQGRFVGLQSVIQQLNPKIAQLTDHQKLYVAQTLFGKQAGQAMLQVIEAGVPSWQKATTAVQTHNAMQSAAQAQMKTLHGEMERISAAVQDLGTKFGLILIPKLTAVVGAVSNVVQWFEKHQAAAVALAGVISGVLGLAISVYAYTKAVAFVNSTKDMVGGIKSLAGGIGSAVTVILQKFGLLAAGSATTAAEVEASNAAEGASFVALDGTVTTAVATADGQMALFAETVATQGAAVEATNAAVGASFMALLGPIGLVAAAAAAAYAASQFVTGSRTGGSAYGQALANRGNMNPAAVAAGTYANGIPLGYGGGATSAFNQANNTNLAGGLPGGYGGGAISAFNLGNTGYNGTQNAPAFAAALLSSVGAPVNAANLNAVVGWIQREGNNPSVDRNNPLDTTIGGFGGKSTNSVGVKSFGSISAGLAATVATLRQSNFAGILASLMAGHGLSGPGASAELASWSGGGYSSTPNANLGNAAIQGLMNAASKAKSPAAKAIKSLLYTSPFAGAAGVNIGRIDEGQDYSAPAGTAIHAIGAGVITRIIQNWFQGQPMVQETLSQGPNAGKIVYYAEQLNSLVKQGQRVQAGQTIGRVAAHGTGLEFGFGSNVGPHYTLAAATTGYREGQQTPAGTIFAHWMAQLAKASTFLTTKGGVVSGGGANLGYSLQQALQTFTAALTKQADALIASYESLQQSGTVKTLTKALGVSTSGKAAGRIHAIIEGLNVKDIQTALEAGNNPKQLDTKLGSMLEKNAGNSAAMQKVSSLIAQLMASGQTELAKALAAQVGSTFATLAQELYAQQVMKDAESIQLQATQEKDQTTLAADTAAKQLQIVKDSNQQILDQMTAAATQIKDATQSMSDSFAAMAQSVTDATTLMADASNAVVTGIADRTQVQVDILGERGLYGLNLIAQQERVQLDEAKAYYDQQIAVAQENLDAVKATWDATVNAARATADQVQMQQDQLVSQQQQATDTVQIAADTKVAAAQAHVDSVTLGQDISVQLAQAVVDLSATAPKAQQDIANAALKRAEAGAARAEATANAQMSAAQATANALVQNAQNALATAQGNAAIAEANAQAALAQAQGQAAVATAQAQATLQGIQDQANQTEATLQGQINITEAEASTQYAGSGLVVNMYGINPADAAANASELGWVLRTQVPA